MKIRKTLLVCCVLVILGTVYVTRGSHSLPKEEVKTAVASPVPQKQAKKDVEQSKRIALSVDLDPQFAP